MAQTGVQMVWRYIRDGSLFRENSAGKLGAGRTVKRRCRRCHYVLFKPL
jgi:hypothetical protein